MGNGVDKDIENNLEVEEVRRNWKTKKEDALAKILTLS
jgi:hypothetical protein